MTLLRAEGALSAEQYQAAKLLAIRPAGSPQRAGGSANARYPDEWVFLVHLEYEDGDMDNGEIIGAVVLGHGKNRRENYQAVKPIVDRECVQESAHFYTGRIAPKGVFLLPRVP